MLGRCSPCRVALVVLAAVSVSLSGCGQAPESSAPSGSSSVLSVSPTGMLFVDAISTDARWLVGTEPREAGSPTPKPLVRLDRQSGDQTVLCDWADPKLGYCSLAEQGGIVEESPTLLLELVDDNAVRGWFPDGGVFLVDTATGTRTRVDVDATGVPLRPAWSPAACEEGCDYHQAPRLEITTDAVSGDGRMAAFCANYTAPRDPLLYVKDLASGELTRTTVRCGVTRFGRENDHDEFSDEGMASPQVSADGAVVHVSGDSSAGGEYGRVGWAADTLYFVGAGESRAVPGSGSMTRDGRTVFLRSGEQAEVPEALVSVSYASYDVSSGAVTPLPWMNEFLGSATVAPVLDAFGQASDDGRLVLNRTAVRDVATGAQVDIASLLREQGRMPTQEWNGLRICGDGTTILADVIEGDPLAEDGGNAVVAVTGWGWAPMAAATLTPVDEQTAVAVDVDPDDVDGPWTFQVERAVQDSIVSSQWEAVAASHTTQGNANRATVDLPTGVYRVRVPAQHGHRAYISEGVWIAPEADE